MGKVYIRIAREVFPLMFTTGTGLLCDQGLPTGARLLGIEYRAQIDCYELSFEHETLPACKEGEAVQRLDVQYLEWKR